MKYDKKVVEQIAVDQLEVDQDLQSRASGLDAKTVVEYREAIQRGSAFPPVKVIDDGEKKWLWDGFHTLEANKREGFKEIHAEVRQGSRRDAVLLSVAANIAHGLRRSNHDKRKAVQTLLDDSEWGQWSSREIAERCGVSHTFVDNLRRERAGNDCQDTGLTPVGPTSSPVDMRPERGGAGSSKPDASVESDDATFCDGSITQPSARGFAGSRERDEAAEFLIRVLPKVVELLERMGDDEDAHQAGSPVRDRIREAMGSSRLLHLAGYAKWLQKDNRREKRGRRGKL